MFRPFLGILIIVAVFAFNFPDFKHSFNISKSEIKKTVVTSPVFKDETDSKRIFPQFSDKVEESSDCGKSWNPVYLGKETKRDRSARITLRSYSVFSESTCGKLVIISSKDPVEVNSSAVYTFADHIDANVSVSATMVVSDYTLFKKSVIKTINLKKADPIVILDFTSPKELSAIFMSMVTPLVTDISQNSGFADVSENMVRTAILDSPKYKDLNSLGVLVSDVSVKIELTPHSEAQIMARIAQGKTATSN